MRKSHRLLKEYARRKTQKFEKIRSVMEETHTPKAIGFGAAIEDSHVDLIKMLNDVDQVRTKVLRGEKYNSLS